MEQHSSPPELPGQYVRDKALKPNKIPVARAAEILGVGRPALSNFLNGKAAVSSDMAARIERAFGIPAQKLFDIQAAHDAAQAKTKGAPAAAKAYVPPFLGIKASEIESWAASNISARSRLPVLLRTLVNSTGVGLSHVDFPGNDDAERAGPDGTVIASEGTPWIPGGRSAWEFGCDQKTKTKADHDYANKTKSTSTSEQKDTTFVFVTPRSWKGKREWEQARRAEGRWKNVRAFDASDLEQWIEQSIPAQAWFASETHRASDGTQSLDQCWADWAEVADPPLPGSLFSTAIKLGAGTVKSMLDQPPKEPIIIAADSTDEALAFLAQIFSEGEGELAMHRDRVVIFREAGVLPRLAAGASGFIAVAATREVEKELAAHCRKIHSVAVYPRNAATLDAHVTLEPLHDTAFRAALEEIGLPRDAIDRLGHESGHSLTVLRRRLANVPAVQTPQWAADAETATRLVPFLLAGAWSAANQSDQTILTLLAGEANYPSVEKTFQALTALDDAPVWSVGTYRGIVSKLDLLFAIGGVLTEHDMRHFLDVAHLVLSEDDPSLDLPEEDRWAANIYGKTREISATLRQSISETLVLLAVHGNTLFQERFGINAEVLVSDLVCKLLTPLTPRTLEAQEGDLPTYAEAAPAEFLTILEDDLNGDDPASLSLMRPAASGPFGDCVRTGLLWALEALAWPPAMLPRVAMVLAKLARVPIDDNWMNKPIESLRAIFRAWMPQTEATVEQRIAAIERLAAEVPEVAWQICVDQFGAYNQVGHYSHKPSWRNDGHGFGEPAPENDVYAFSAAMADMALAWPSHNRETLSDLVTRLQELDEPRQARVWNLIRHWASQGATDEDKAWLRESIRVAVLSARAVRRAKKRKTKDLRTPASDAYEALEPTDILQRHEWLFRLDWVEESADELHEEEPDFRKRDERVYAERTEALRDILDRRGLDGILELAEMGDAAARIGGMMTTILPRKRVAEFVLTAMPTGSESLTPRQLVWGALHALEDKARSEVLSDVRGSIDQAQFADILTLAPFVGTTWALVDELDDTTRQRYWAEVSPNWQQQTDDDLNTGVECLITAKRPRAAFAWVHFSLKKIRPALLFRLISEIATGKHEPPDHYRLDAYYVADAFELLDASGEFTLDQMAGLEFPYVEALSRRRGAHGTRGIPNIERYIERHPEFFAEVVAWVFKRQDGKEDPDALRTGDPELLKSRGQRGYRLLEALERIPGRDKRGDIAFEPLLKWITAVRQACAALGRQELGDVRLGDLMANAPSDENGIWPCEPVRDVLERVASRDIARGVRTGLYNARGVHSRGEGGDQERGIAAKYRRWASALEFSHPYVAGILTSMADSYEEEGRAHDTDAIVRRRLGR